MGEYRPTPRKREWEVNFMHEVVSLELPHSVRLYKFPIYKGPVRLVMLETFLPGNDDNDPFYSQAGA